MEELRQYHHFKYGLISSDDRISICERAVVDLLLSTGLPDTRRESSVCWELKHQASTLQFARILARKRSLPVDVCSVGMMLHDIYSIIHGTYKDHAHLGTPLAMDILREIGGFTDKELDQIHRIIYNHSDKHIWTDDPFQEFGKDVDVLDCFLYEGAFDFYLGNKPLSVFTGYLERAKRVWKELGLPPDPRFSLLDDYGPSWFQRLQASPIDTLRKVLAVLIDLASTDVSRGLRPPPFCIASQDGRGTVYGNRPQWYSYNEEITTRPDNLFSKPLQRSCLAILAVLLENQQEKSGEETMAIGQGISEKALTEASNILQGEVTNSHTQPHAFMFWPLVGIYESLAGERAAKRLEELGVVSCPSKIGENDVS